ncbi:FadR/GntR family transcriptional regulator [Saccharopolyspora pogona]|uniref:FadR/GntR family transcriptional regulator n=1 Tax=Saccharopolyspora pogona TaxID=333966 RepID=UPI0016893797|nr:FadR/GntR family transcriptional regulator [Saccharopolyspora pogona]
MAGGGRLLQDKVVDLILEAGLPPGAPLPSEPQLMAQFGASRNSIRETLRALHTLGIVDIRHGYGTFVGEAPVTALLPGLLFRARQSARQDASTLADFIQLRRILETALISEVPRHADDELIGELETCIAEMRSGDVVEADRRFHQALYRPVGNEIAVQLIDLFWTVYHRVEAEIDRPEVVRDEIGDEHQRIVDAIRAGDSDAAAEEMARHFSGIERRSRRFVDKQR